MTHLKSAFALLIFAFLTINLSACKSGESQNPMAPTFYFPPVVTGLWITTESGPDPIMTWANPSGNFHPYPNPFSSIIVIPFEVEEDLTKVRVWVVHAKSPYDNHSGSSQFNGTIVVQPNGLPVIVHELTAYSGFFYPLHLQFQDLPSGYYRVYLEIDGAVDFTDILLAKKPWDIPPYLNYNPFDE